MPPRVWLPWDSLRPLLVAPLVAVCDSFRFLALKTKCVCVTWSRSVTVSWVVFLNEREVLVPRLSSGGQRDTAARSSPGRPLPALPEPHGGCVHTEGTALHPGSLCSTREESETYSCGRGEVRPQPRHRREHRARLPRSQTVFAVSVQP